MGSNIDKSLPGELRNAAFRYHGEWAWRAPTVMRVIDFLAEHDQAVLGVELWHEEHGYPKWLNTTTYDDEAGAPKRPWEQYVLYCRDEAKRFVEENAGDPDAWFNLTWGPKERVEALRGKGLGS